MKRVLSGSSSIVKELIDNVLEPLVGEHLMVAENDNETACTWETDSIPEVYVRMLETLLYHRAQEGLLDNINFEVMEDLLEGTYHVVTNDMGKAQSIVKDVFKTAGVSDSKIFMGKQPLAQDMLNFSCYVVLAVGLTVEEEKAINASFAVKKFGAKVSKTIGTVGTAAHGSSKIIMKDIIEPAAKISGRVGGTIASGAINATASGLLAFTDEFTGDLKLREIAKSEEAGRIASRFKSLFNKNGDAGSTGSKTSKRF
jgi:hypothetical protein